MDKNDRRGGTERTVSATEPLKARVLETAGNSTIEFSYKVDEDQFNLLINSLDHLTAAVMSASSLGLNTRSLDELERRFTDYVGFLSSCRKEEQEKPSD